MLSYRAVPVWDGLVRFTHWVNAFAVLALLALGTLIWVRKPLGLSDTAQDAIVDVHAAIGFLFAATLITRIAYGLAGPEGSSHWKDVVPHTKAQFRLALATIAYYLRGFKGECPLYFAHNPLAGLAYTGFFLLGIWQAFTGAAMYLLGSAITPAHAHAAHELAATAGADKWPPEWLLNMHLFGGIGIALFIVAHLSALALHDLVEKRGLASSMISGNKFFTDAEIAELGQGDTASDKGTTPACD